MATLQDPPVREMLEQPNYAVVSTINRDGSIHNTIVWVSAENGSVAVNTAVGRIWPTNLQRNPQINVLVFEAGNPFHFVEIRGQATASTEDADEHADALAKKYLGQDKFAGGTPGEQRIKFTIAPEHVRYVKQG